MLTLELLANIMLKYKSKFIQNILINENYYSWLTPEDFESLRIWRNQQKNILRQVNNINKKDQKKYFVNFYKENCFSNKPLNIIFAIKEKHRLIGYGGLVNISWQNKRAEVSFLLNTSIANNKKKYEFYFKNFFTFISKASFEKLKLNKIFTETFIFRKNHIKLLNIVGFKKEGFFKNHYYKKNKKISSILHAKFR
jgi:RimJ/RimL family protein N-acetyltransferase